VSAGSVIRWWHRSLETLKPQASKLSRFENGRSRVHRAVRCPSVESFVGVLNLSRPVVSPKVTFQDTGILTRKHQSVNLPG
jgi:hypothetical protein